MPTLVGLPFLTFQLTVSSSTAPNSLSTNALYIYISYKCSHLKSEVFQEARLEIDYLNEKAELDRRTESKLNPIVNRARWRWRWRWLRSMNKMPLDILNESDGSPRVLLSEPGGSSAEVLLHGGQVVSWKNGHGQELLFMSRKAFWKSSKAIRGGISICFPQLGNLGSMFNRSPRNRLWSVDNCPLPLTPTSNHSSVDLIFNPAKEDMKMWQHSFELRLHISLAPGKLALTPSVRNTDNKPFAFTFSLCNYLSVSDISEVRVEGLETLDYFDNMMQRKRFTEQADAVTFEGEVDRVYLSTPTKIAIIDHGKKRTFVMHKEGLPDAVVWHPWEKMAKALPDLGDQDYKTMLYICSAAAENPIALKPLEEWKGRQELSVVSSSYCSGQLDPGKVLCGFT